MQYIHFIKKGTLCKLLVSVLLILICSRACCQVVQMNYDLRHTVDPTRNSKNYPTLYFEYYKAQDSGKSFIKPGSFLFKMQADLLGEKSNAGKFYMQVSQSFRCWQPKIFLNLQYSGGMGVTEPKQYSYYIANTFSAGLSYPLKWGSAYFTSVLNYKIVTYSKPSYDALYTLYWWQGLFNYKMELAGDFSVWTENKNQGDAITKDLHGKRFFFFAEPQVWWHLYKSFAAGARINMYYHVLTTDNILQVYPAAAIKVQL